MYVCVMCSVCVVCSVCVMCSGFCDGGSGLSDDVSICCS